MDKFPVLLVDIETKKIEPVLTTSKLTTNRFNYSTCLSGLKIFIFGGLNYNMEPTNELDFFDLGLTTFYKFVASGKPPQPRHSASMIHKDRKIFVFGGQRDFDFFLREPEFESIYVLKLVNSTWYRVESPGFDQIKLGEISTFHFDSDKILILGAIGEGKRMHCGLFDQNNFDYIALTAQNAPSFRYYVILKSD